MPAPDKATITKTLARARTYWNTTHTYMKTEDKYFRNARDLTLPKNIPDLRQVTLPIAHAIITRAQQNVPLSALKIEGIPRPGSRGTPQKSLEMADAAEGWLYGAHEEDGRRAHRHRQQPPLLKAVTLQFLRGMVYLKTIEDISAYEPVKNDGESEGAFKVRHSKWVSAHLFPYPMFSVDPLAVFDDPGGDMIFEERKRYAGDIVRELESLRLNIPDGLRNKDNEIVWRECWTDEWVTYYAADEYIDARKHGYGFIPYVPAFSGLGSLTELTGEEDDGPQNLAVGLIRYIQSYIDERDYTTTEIAHQRRALTWPFGHLPKGMTTPLPNEWKEMEPGDEKPAFVMPPDKIGELVAYSNSLSGEIDSVTTPAVLGGQSAPRQTTATEFVNVLGSARLIIQNPMDALAAAVEVSNEQRLRLLEMSGGKDKKRSVQAQRYRQAGVDGGYKLQVDSYTLSAADIDGWYANRVTITPTNPQQEALEINNARLLYQDGVISKEEYARRAKIEDFQEQQVRRGGEDIIASAPMVEARAQVAAAAWKVRIAKRWTEGEPGELEKTMADMQKTLEQTPSGMNIPPQMEGQVPGSPAQTAQMLQGPVPQVPLG